MVSKGESALGTKFRLGALQIRDDDHLNFGSIMATEDNTVINITLPTGNGQQLTSGRTSSNIILNAGQSYVFASENRNDSSYGIIETLVESDKPIVVNSGSGLGSFADQLMNKGVKIMELIKLLVQTKLALSIYLLEVVEMMSGKMFF